MQWTKKDDYYIESESNKISATHTVKFSISKSMVYGKPIYTLWELPYNAAKMLMQGEKVNELKAKAIQCYREQLTSASDKAAGIAQRISSDTTGSNQGALF